MKRSAGILILSLGLLLTLTCFRPSPYASTTEEFGDMETATLYDSIVALDASWEDAYNHCKLDAMNALISEDLEFYHDQGGLMTSKQKLMEALQKNICGKVTRELKKGSIEVYPIAGYGAVEMGMHAFHNNKEPNSETHYAKFVHLWKKDHGQWRITRVISLH